MAEHLKELYTSRVSDFKEKLRKSERFIRNISLLRLLDFILAFVAVYYFAQKNFVPGIAISLFISIAIFLLLIRIHSKAILQRNLHKAYLKINKEELEAVSGTFSSFRNGEEFEDPTHRYTSDLDIFGHGSIFQFLNRACTETGYKKLSSKLSNPSNKTEEILDNQQTIAELCEKLEWRQKFQAIGVAFKEGPDDRKKIEDWTVSEPQFANFIFRLLVFLIPPVTVFMIVLNVFGNITFQMLILYLMIPWTISGMFAIRISRKHREVGHTSDMLTKYAMLLKEIESFEPSSSKLQKLKKEVYGINQSAGSSIKALSAILTALDNRLNFVSWTLLNGLLLWDILQMIRLEAWQKKHKDDVFNWFNVVSEVDALCSFANFKFNQEDAVFPELLISEHEIKAEQTGHPLINRATRVDNDILLKEGEIIIITGANMAGKSTYLRTIGVNMILAMCGSVVCAKSFAFKPVTIFTSIRTKDSLVENESYFYAELKRLKAIIDALRNGEKLFIILDEILKGTNSKDKHSGSEALLKQLITFKASGIVATHDVLLGKLAEKFPDSLRNHCFEVDIEGNQLNFDYLLREGVSKNMNATILMREMGITI